MPRDFYYGTDVELYSTAKTFSDAISSDPAFYGISQQQADQFALLCQDYREKYSLANSAATRTKIAVSMKNEAKKALRNIAMLLSRIIVANPDVTSADRIAIGLNSRGESTKIHAPSKEPHMRVVSVNGRIVTIRVNDFSGSSAGKPKTVIGAAVFAYIGEDEPPANIRSWQFMKNISKTTTDIVFPADLVPGSKVWFTAFWFNSKMENSPCAKPVCTNIQGGGLVTEHKFRVAA